MIRFGYTGVSGMSEDLEAIFNHQPKTVAFGLSSEQRVLRLHHRQRSFALTDRV